MQRPTHATNLRRLQQEHAVDLQHLRKQAKRLARLYPGLAQAHPASISLAVAQSVIARINGFPSWEAMSAEQDPRPGPTKKAVTVDFDLSKHLYFAVTGLESRLPVSYSEATGNPTRYRKGVEAILSYTSKDDERRAVAEDKKLDALFERAFGPTFDTSFNNLDTRARLKLLTAVQSSLKVCRFCPETYARLAGLWFANGAYEQAVEVVEPIAEQLLALIPTDRYVQAPYGYLDNRPFHRLAHGYVLCLDKIGRHADADRWAKKMVSLCPSDNIGFVAWRTIQRKERYQPHYEEFCRKDAAARSWID